MSGAVSLVAGRYTGKDDTRLLNWVNEFNGNEYLVPQIWNGPVSTAQCRTPGVGSAVSAGSTTELTRAGGHGSFIHGQERIEGTLASQFHFGVKKGSTLTIWEQDLSRHLDMVPPPPDSEWGCLRCELFY